MLLQRINGIASPALRQLTHEDRDEPWLYPSDMALRHFLAKQNQDLRLKRHVGSMTTNPRRNI